MTEISYRSLVWLAYRLGATFAFGLPITLWVWASIKKEFAITRLLQIYWKVASLIVISMLLLTGNRGIGFITSFVSPILLLISIWFWIDINEELNEMYSNRYLAFATKLWRWVVSIFSCYYAAISFQSLTCMNEKDIRFCNYWLEAPNNLNQSITHMFNFLFGANWTSSISSFIGYLALIVYIVGLIQWLFIRLPKQGRIAGGF